MTRLQWISVVAATLGFVAASHAEAILVQVPAVFDPGAAIRDAVRLECGVDVLLGNEVFERVKARFPESVPVQKSTGAESGKVLNVTILFVHAAGGGVWSGGKSMTVRADLVESGKVIATTVKERRTTGGAFGGFKGTCEILQRVTAALGSDIAAWLSRTLVGEVQNVSATPAEPQSKSGSEPAPQPGKTD